MRIRVLLSNNWSLAIVAFLVIAVVGGYAVWVVQSADDTETEQQVETVSEWATDGTFDHSAVVQQESRVFSEGQQLENQPLYFTRLSPMMEGTYTLEHSGDVDTAVGAVSLELVLQAVDDGDDDEEIVYWRETESLATEDVELTGDETHETSFSMNVSGVAEEIDEIESQIGASPGTSEMVIRAEATLEGETDHGPFTSSRSEQLEIEVNQGTYSISEDSMGTDPHEHTQEVAQEVPVEHPWYLEVGGPLLLLVGLIGTVAVGFLRYNGTLTVTPAERQQLAFAKTRAQYSDWISKGTVPPVTDERVVTVNSLTDLVDVAIDSNARAIESEDGQSYVVLTGNLRYVYTPTTFEQGDDTETTANASEETDGAEPASEAETDLPEER